ncbi:serine/threonine-protein kinase [Saccharothrix syringae]|uniref:non-specific serine/threonine protein kinase n=1 Tax=Saccharothrix syringae TaxID=103733 RepID=A0A5Q0GX20_SACSY|nr:serine/threonine-protein kinase [Saccharothrix syringae]QFZ18225.1 serine/threonine protein kinase [Saccharothrix syringae]
MTLGAPVEDRTIAGRYRLTEKIGTGGMGVVWRAEDTRLRRIVAVKELMSRSGFDQESVDRAVREGRIAARLQHPNVIALYDVVEHDGHPWLVMEYLPSRSLAGVLAERGTLPPDEVARLGGQLASGLSAAHAAGVVHRDVKPGNVLVTEFGTVKLTDFGTSRAADEVTVTASGMLVGTPAYLAPEVARGDRGGFPADVFALGATLYAAVEGEPPFGVDGNAIALLHRVADGRFAPPEHAGPLGPVLMRLLDPNPETRPTMAEAERMLNDVRFEHKAKATALLAAPLAPVEPAEQSEAPAPVVPAAPEPVPAAEPTPQPVSRPAPAPVPAPAPPLSQPSPRSQPSPVSRPPEEGRGDRKALAALGIAVLLVAALVVYLLNRGDDDPSTGSGPGETTTSAQPTTTGQQQQPPVEPTTEPQQQTTTTTTTTEPPQTTTQDTTQPPAEVGAAQALTDYYALLPNNLEAGYARLSDRMKAARAPSFAAYQEFWGRMSAVTVSNASETGPNTVSATITYTYRGGGTESETNVYTLVKASGQWLIDTQN